MTTMRILVVDDHPLIRRGVNSLLESHPGWTVCGEAANGNEAVAKTKKLRPEVAILDFSMPGLDGVRAAEQIRSVSSKTEILILSLYCSDELIKEIVKAGIRAYVLKSDAAHDLELAVEALARHKSFFSSRATQTLLNYANPFRRADSKMTRSDLLTPREREVMVLVAEGKFNKAIAERLGIVRKTVEAHRARLMHKLGLTTVPDLVRYAVRNHIIEA